MCFVRIPYSKQNLKYIILLITQRNNYVRAKIICTNVKECAFACVSLYSNKQIQIYCNLTNTKISGPHIN